MLCKIRGVDLFAKEAQFHECCRQQYLVQRAPQLDAASGSSKKDAIQKAFTQVCDHINAEVILKGQVVKLVSLTTLYNDTLKQFGECAASQITSSNLRQKIESCPVIKDSVEFSSDTYKETLLFSKCQESMKTTVRSAYEMGITDWCKEVSHDLHKRIVNAFKNSEEIPWPPTAHNLPDPNDVIPSEVLQFVSNLICGERKPSHREESLATSSIIAVEHT